MYFHRLLKGYGTSTPNRALIVVPVTVSHQTAITRTVSVTRTESYGAIPILIAFLFECTSSSVMFYNQETDFDPV